QLAHSKTLAPETVLMNRLVLDASYRFSKKHKWVFTKPTGTPYTARSRKCFTRILCSGSSELGLEG
ncbi:MAG: hypothetical protein MRJ68_18215, partial [Nitrospira sp.]|nr:hypothetical protein [Nitrospira sp.]